MILIKTDKEIQSMRAGGEIHARILRLVAEKIQPGITTGALNDYAEELCREHNVIPAFKDYQPEGQSYPYPATLCTSVNDEIVHGIPDHGRILNDGDIIAIDLGIQHDGVFLDGAITVAVGTVSPEIQQFIDDTRQALLIGIDQARVGNTTGDIGNAIEQFVNGRYGIVRGLAGHGVGRMIHEDPYIPNYGKPGTGTKLVSGMTVAIEPMLTMGDKATEILEDDYTFVTADGSFAAHFEHTLLITESGPEILTKE